MDSAVATNTQISSEAFEIRRKNFSDDILFFAPGLKKYEIPGFTQKNPQAFLPISLTGSGCALDCDHCETKILEPMIPLDVKNGLFAMCENMAKNGTESVLISGGSMKNGQVPFLKHIEDITRIKKELGLKIIMHTGLVDEPMVEGLKNAGVDGVALDIIGAQETIEQVYHLSTSVEDFDRSLYLLTEYGLSIRPHIILGLHYGKFLGEYPALDMISKYPVHALIVVIFMPIQGTKMQNVTPPDTAEVEDFLIKSRLKLPRTRILLGCARPGGEYKKIVDRAAIEAGINGIAYPAEGIIEYSQELGLSPSFYENSCSCGVD
jgi:lipoyl synthase